MLNFKHFILAALLMVAGSAAAQRAYTPKFSVGARAGATFSNIAFTPKVEQALTPGYTFGAVFRYSEEKIVGLMAEINVAQRGWKESYDPGLDWQYKRTLTYIDIPVMTHIFFGPKRFKCFVNLGPEVAFLLGSNITSNFDYANMKDVKGYPPERQTYELYAPISSRVDYGITGGVGFEYRLNPRNSLMIEARYYFGLGNIFPNHKRDVFSGSRVTSIEVTGAYLFRLK